MSARFSFPQEVEDAILSAIPTASRREFLKTSGALVLSCSVSFGAGERVLAQDTSRGPYPEPDFRQLDTWIVIHSDNTATFFVGKTDGGQGTGTAFRQMMCDELDIAYDRTSLIMGSTDTTPDQGGSGGSDAIERDGWPMRRVAAEARRVLLELAAEQLQTSVDELSVSNGSISITGQPSRSVTYAELIGGQRFDIALTGNNVNATSGIANVKPVGELRVIGQSLPRYDIPAKVDGSLTWAADIKLPNMAHARNVRPPVAGATVTNINEASVADIAGFIRVVHRGNYIAVVCEREEQAIQAARQLQVEWEPPGRRRFLHPMMFMTTCVLRHRYQLTKQISMAMSMRHLQPPNTLLKPTMKCRFRDTRQSDPHMHLPIRLADK